jgi:hypothetical protein
MHPNYSDFVLAEVPRLLSLMDRNRFSPTYGCFDRQYWKYRTIDYANARMQEACLTLALLCRNRFGGRFYRNEKISEFAKAAVGFWSGMQNRDGSFNEYMPNEHSHVATAFSTYCAAEAYRILGIRNESILDSLVKAGIWLGKNEDLVVVNHDAGAVAALYMIYQITGDRRFLGYCRRKLKKVLGSQNSEGWFSEYGGADIGYQSFSIYYLAKYLRTSGDRSVLKPIENAVRFFSYFIHPDHSIGGFYGNRETGFVIPAGFEMIPGPLSRSVSVAIRKSLGLRRITGPYSFDDRFVADGLYPYLEAQLNHKPGNSRMALLPKDQGSFERRFKSAGLFVKKTGKFYMVVNAKKGGVMKVFSSGRLVHEDSGWVQRDGGRILTNNGPSECIMGKSSVDVSGWLYRPKFRYQSPVSITVVRLLGSAGVHGKLKSAMRRSMILRQGRSGIRFHRKIMMSGGRIEVEDSFRPKVSGLILSDNFSYIYSTSTGLYRESGKKGSANFVVSRPVDKTKIVITPGKVYLKY